MVKKEAIYASQSNYIFEAKFLSWVIYNQSSEDAVKLIKKLTADMFSNKTTKEIFKFIAGLIGITPIDYDVFLEYAQSFQFDVIDNDLVNNIFNFKTFDNENFDIDSYVKQIKAEFAKRQVAEKAINIHNQASSGSNIKDLANQMSSIQEELAEHLDDDDDDEILSMGEEYHNFKKEMEEDYEKSLNGELKTKTLIGDFDRLTGGFTNGDLVIIGARPSMGKTSLALSMLYGMLMSKPDGVFVFFSAEVSPKKIKGKLTAIHANLSARIFTDFDSYDEYRDIVDEAIDVVHRDIAKQRLYILNANNKSTAYIKKTLTKIYKKHGRIDGAFLDYLQILKLENRRDKHIEIGEASKDLKRFAMFWDMPFIALSQLNRNLENRDDKRPVSADLRDSGDIEQDADLIVFIYRDDVYQKKKKDTQEYEIQTQSKISIAELIVAKHRNGPTGTVYSSFVKETTRFVTATIQDELESLKNEMADIDNSLNNQVQNNSRVIEQGNEKVIVIGQSIKKQQQGTTLFDPALAGGGDIIQLCSTDANGMIRMED